MKKNHKLFSFLSDNQEKILLICLAFVLACVLTPMLYISKYNVVSSDDFAALNHRGTYLGIFGNALEYAKMNYFEWRGTYFGIFFTAFLLQLFGADHYGVISNFVILTYTVCTIGAICSILKSIFKTDYVKGLIVGTTVAIWGLCMPPYAVEAFYWAAGTLLYTNSWSIYLVIIACIVKLIFTEDKPVIPLTLTLVLNFIVGGSNYPTAMTLAVIYIGAVGLAFIIKCKNKMKVLAAMIGFFVAFLLNVLAPGNLGGISENSGNSRGIIGSILSSFTEAGTFINVKMLPPIFWLCIILIPIIVQIVKNSEYDFKYPIVFSIFSFCVYATHFTPNLFTLGIIGAGRTQDIYFWSMLNIILINEVYWVGWLQKRYELKSSDGKSRLLMTWIVGGLLLCYAQFFWGSITTSPVSAVYSLRRGIAQGYYQEYETRVAQASDSSVDDVVWEPYYCTPYLLYFGDLSNDPEDSFNKHAATFYGKKSITIAERE